MKVEKSSSLAVAFCVVLAAGSVWVNETLSHLGDVYWSLLWSLALIHLILSAVLLVATRHKLLIGTPVLALFIIGQWHAMQMIAMMTIWSLRGFAP
jgi:hypothetical protein